MHIINLVIIMLLLVSCGTSQPQTTSATAITKDSPPYAKLAVIEAESPNPPASLLATFKMVMESLSKKCHKETPEHIADFIVKSQEMLREKNVDLKLSEIAKYVDQSIPDGTQVSQCSDVFAAFVVLTGKE